MIFSSFEFVVFLLMLLVVLAFRSSEHRRRTILLVASYVFYGWWDWRFLFLIVFSTLVDYYVGRCIHRTEGSRRRWWLVASLVTNLGLLGFFKYTNFFIDSLNQGLGPGWVIPNLEIILPVGISFFTFQTMSYSIDIYRGKLEPCASFRDFALFVAFFPQLVAGPIVRASEFMPQLQKVHPLRRGNLVDGGELFLKGFIKKILLADTLAVYADPVFADPASFGSVTCWLAVLAYTGQIYYDFSGYTDMAIGVGRMLGFELPVNFRHPYISRNITEFWRRWHISLSSWLRDYLYISLGGNRRGRVRTYVNLGITMVLGGLWHGASWNFVIWGALHGAALAIHKVSLELRGRRADAETSRPRQVVSWFFTMLLVIVCWVFFRAETFDKAIEILAAMAFVGGGQTDWFYVPALVVTAFSVVLHLGTVLRREKEYQLSLRSPLGIVIAVVVMIIVLMFAPLDSNPFIYFQF